MRKLLAVVVAVLASTLLTSCGDTMCEDTYDALWMVSYHSDGTKTCTYIGGDGDSAYNLGGVSELPYPG
ncbi:hypothetical protein [Kineococcus sp. SYSU DK004]|uniref:hypothetical protein n=1 Tax=Kineococcus sp. SYSU DK004 TaxID=3383125 RepID=UPI003D7CE2D6